MTPTNEARPAETGGAGWIIGSGDGKRFRTWTDGMSDWTSDRTKATRYARREDAEAVHWEDEDAWTVAPYATPDKTVNADRERWESCNCAEPPFDDEVAYDRSGSLRCPRCNVALGGDPMTASDRAAMNAGGNKPVDLGADAERAALACYNAGLLGDGGGGDVGWWQDYIRAELDSAHEFYAAQFEHTPPASVDATIERCAQFAEELEGTDEYALGETGAIADAIRARFLSTDSTSQDGEAES